jgi:hypothetical protein
MVDTFDELLSRTKKIEEEAKKFKEVQSENTDDNLNFSQPGSSVFQSPSKKYGIRDVKEEIRKNTLFDLSSNVVKKDEDIQSQGIKKISQNLSDSLQGLLTNFSQNILKYSDNTENFNQCKVFEKEIVKCNVDKLNNTNNRKSIEKNLIINKGDLLQIKKNNSYFYDSEKNKIISALERQIKINESNIANNEQRIFEEKDVKKVRNYESANREIKLSIELDKQKQKFLMEEEKYKFLEPGYLERKSPFSMASDEKTKKNLRERIEEMKAERESQKTLGKNKITKSAVRDVITRIYFDELKNSKGDKNKTKKINKQIDDETADVIKEIALGSKLGIPLEGRLQQIIGNITNEQTIGKITKG